MKKPLGVYPRGFQMGAGLGFEFRLAEPAKLAWDPAERDYEPGLWRPVIW
jgi:hypothetical protein